MLFVQISTGLEKAFDYIPRRILFSRSMGYVAHCYGLCGPVRAWFILMDPLPCGWWTLLVLVIDSVHVHNFQWAEFLDIAKCGPRISSLLFVDDVILFASSDIQLVLWLLAKVCEAERMRIGTLKSETIVLSWKRVACQLYGSNKLLSQVEDFR